MESVEIIPNRLYFSCSDTPDEENKQVIYFSIDDELVYDPYFLDFGPLDLGKVYRFC